MSEADPPLRKMSASEFARRLKDNANDQDRHYVFWLGAGCSVSSGIPASSSLVRDVWLPRLHNWQDTTESVEAWAAKTFPGYNLDAPGLSYGPVMDRRFPVPDERQRETERLCEGRIPGFGYAVLAVLMSRPDGIFSASLTTNFDDLIADAMYVFGTRRPLVIQHEALAGFARPGRVQRPLVVKVHGDHRLNPMHTREETADLKASIAKGIRGLLQDRGVIFVGYAGNDQGVIEALEDLPKDALPLGTWWVSRSEPTSAIRTWLQARQATWVETSGFDEFMLLLREEFDIAHPTPERFEQMFDGYRDTYANLNASVSKLAQSSIDSEPLKEAARRASTQAPEEWWRVLLVASELEHTDPDSAEHVYEEGIRTNDDARLVGSYAWFLTSVRGEHDRAQALYERALDTDPNNAAVRGGYALFLTSVRGEHDQAQALYERALEADPNNTSILGNYALFLTSVRGEHDQAQALYERALETDPNNTSILGNYAIFLAAVRNEEDRAQELFERALETDPNNTIILGGYALFLTSIRGEHDRAQELYKRALDTDPNNAKVLGSYALFLTSVRGEHDQAQALYERALEADPNNTSILGNYALFLTSVRGEHDQAQALYERALETDPNNTSILDGYALFLTSVRGEHDRAQALYERALETDPNNTGILGNYARLQFEIGGDDQALDLVARAFERATYDDDPLRVELWFYLLALGPTDREAEALSGLATLIERDVRSPGWDFSRILERAGAEHRQDIDWLVKLADVISSDADPDVLGDWDRWPSA
jgi:Tfp pilus assembly protein PilF